MANQSNIITANDTTNIFFKFQPMEKNYTQPKESFDLHDMVIITGCLLFSLVMLTCLCGLCMKISDLKLKCYITRTARRKGLNVDMAKLNTSYCPPKDETCAIYVPDMYVTCL